MLYVGLDLSRKRLDWQALEPGGACGGRRGAARPGRACSFGATTGRWGGRCGDRVDGLTIDSGRSAITLDQLKRMLQKIGSCQFTAQAPEPIVRFGLGFAIERALELPNFLGSSYFY